MLCSRVAFSYNMADIAVMKTICEAAEIEVFDINISGQISFAGGDSGFYLDVPNVSAVAARAELAETEYAKYIIE